MENDYLEKLPLSDNERAVISSLGVSSAASLLGMMRVSPEEFSKLLGSDRAQELAIALEASINECDRLILNAPDQHFWATGAVIGRRPPAVRPPNYDLAERDDLHDQLLNLQRQPNPSPEVKQRIAKLEQRLNSMLEGGAG